MTSSFKKPDRLQLLFTLLGGVVLLFIVAPLLAVFLRSAPGLMLETAQESAVQSSIWLTLWTSFCATLLFALPAVPFAWLLARGRFPLGRLVRGVIDLPVIIPHSAAGIALLVVLSREGLLGGLAERIGLQLTGAPAGIMLAMAFVSIPFLIHAAHDGFKAVPERLEKVALSLGASPWRVFLTITLPLARRSILSGMILMWARGMSEFGAVIIIAYHPMVTPVMMYERLGSFGLKYALPVTAVFLLVSFALFGLMRLVAGDKDVT